MDIGPTSKERHSFCSEHVFDSRQEEEKEPLAGKRTSLKAV